ncbi:MAG: protein kinase [Akkermansiaceae bacterium]|nr:protein kinase [Akkermansiaceae bacterium]
MKNDFVPPSLEELAALLPAYDFEILIARGGMGAVYRAKQKSLGRDVAVKVLPREMGRDPRYRESFETEARAMARLNHPNLISVYDSGAVDEMLYIVMEYVPGKSLYHSSYGKQVDPEQVVELIQGICAGLGHAHENGIIHRDIKPANVLLTAKAEPKIGDFGLARPTDATGAGLVMGTPGYTAPELIHNPQLADRRSDLYAVGVLLYELLTGQRQTAESSPPSQLCACGTGMDDIWRKATHPQPDQRFQHADEFRRALSRWLESYRRTKALAPKPVKPAAPLVKGTIPRPGQGEPEPPAAVKQIQIEMHSSWGLIRNLFIIAFLIVAVAVVWKMSERQRRAIEENQIKETSKSFELKAREEAEARERAAEAERRHQEERERLAAARQGGSQGSNDGIAADTAKPPPRDEPKPETPLDVLARLRFELAEGKRDQLPPGTVRHGDSAFFVVPTPMTWAEAAWYAERFGGHLPTPGSSGDLTWLETLAPGDESIWLGGGKSGRTAWTMIDGRVWGTSPAPRGTGLYVGVGRLGLRTFDGKTKMPFAIQWRLNGSNPATLANSLQAARESLGDANPVYPPGTVAYDSRMFVYVARPVAWKDAAELAELAGGHLAVVSNAAEAGHLAEYLNGQAVENGIWLGGFRGRDGWAWVSGEPWSKGYWAGGKEPDTPNQALLVEPGKGWQAVDMQAVASGFVIEWSPDAGRAGASPVTGMGEGVAGDALAAKAKELAVAADRKRLDAFIANAKEFAWDLDVWLKTLSQNERAAWQPHVAGLKAMVRQSRVPAAMPQDSKVQLHPEMSRIATQAAAKQTAINSEFLAEITRIRQAYQTRLRSEIQKAENAGDIDRGRALRKDFQNAADNETWLAGLGIRAAAEAPAADE